MSVWTHLDKDSLELPDGLVHAVAEVAVCVHAVVVAIQVQRLRVPGRGE